MLKKCDFCSAIVEKTKWNLCAKCFKKTSVRSMYNPTRRKKSLEERIKYYAERARQQLPLFE